MKRKITRVVISLLIFIATIPTHIVADISDVSIQMNDISFGSVFDSTGISPTNLNITNTGEDIDTKNTQIVLSNEDAFTLSGKLNGKFKYGQTKNNVSVVPKEGLAAGTYTATVSFLYDYDGDGNVYSPVTVGSCTVSLTVLAQEVTQHALTINNGMAVVRESITNKAKAGDTVYILANSTPEMNFTSWTVNKGNVALADATDPDTSFTMPDEDVEITAVYEASTPIPTVYHLTVNNGSAFTSSNENVTEVPEGTIVTIVANEDTSAYVFNKWTVISGGVTLADENSRETTFTMPANDVELTADRKTVTHTVSFVMNGHGTSIKNQTVNDNEKASKPADPAALDYVFEGWYTDNNTFLNKYDFDTPVTTDLTLYAKWIDIAAIPFSITVNTIGKGTAYAEFSSAVKGTLVNLYYTAQEGSILKEWILNGKTLTTNNYFFMPAKDAQLTAVFTEIIDAAALTAAITAPKKGSSPSNATVTADPSYDASVLQWTDEKGNLLSESDTFLEKHSYTAKVKFTPKEGYSFPDATPPALINEIDCECTGFDLNGSLIYEVSFYLPATYTVSFDMGGHGTQIDPVLVTENETLTQPETPVETGYTFMGWYTDDTYTTTFDFTTPINEDMTLYGEWTEKLPDTYNIFVHIDGNGIASADKTSAIKDETVTLTATAGTGYHFKEWQSEDVDASGGSFSMPEKDVIVTAVFEKDAPVTHTITFDMGGHGTQIVPVTLTETEMLNEPAEPTETGHVFKGWFIDPECTIEFFFPTVITMDLTVYGKWEEAAVVPVVYHVTVAMSEYTKGSGLGGSFVSDAPFDKFDKVIVDSTELTSADFKAESGSTKVTLFSSFLEKLTDGVHMIRIVSADGEASAKFKVNLKPEEKDPVLPYRIPNTSVK